MPIAEVCLGDAQKQYVDFESFFTHTICHECCHGIGPHTITLPSGKGSTVRLVIVEAFSWPGQFVNSPLDDGSGA